MKKMMVYMMTAATTLTVMAAQPLTAFAANGTYGMLSGKDCWTGNKPAVSWNLDCIQKAESFGFGVNGNLGGNSFWDNYNQCEENNQGSGNNQWNGGSFGNGNNQWNNGNQGNGGNVNGGGNFNDNIQDSSQSAWTQQVVKLVNEERAKAGLSALKLNTNVAAAAQTRTRELSSSFSHTRPNGSHFSTALKEQGVSYSSAGENIAYGQTSPEAVMKQWLNSSGHRANILNPDFTEIGVGHVETDSGVHYWTQLFIR